MAGVVTADARLPAERGPATEHFVGTPPQGARWVEEAIGRVGVDPSRWRVPLEAIARFETDWNPTPDPDGALRGLMQQSVGQYAAARERFPGLIDSVDYSDPRDAVVVAILYIQGRLSGYGGYGGIDGLLERTDRGPGEVIRMWRSKPESTFQELRRLYHGY